MSAPDGPDVLAAANDALAGPAALVIVLMLLVITVFLIRNMDRRLRRLPKEFPAPAAKKGAELPPRG